MTTRLSPRTRQQGPGFLDVAPTSNRTARRRAASKPGRAYHYPAQPLALLFRDEYGLHDEIAAAEAFEIDVRTWRDWLDTGLTWDQADIAATRAGFHPVNIWPDWDSEALHADEMHFHEQVRMGL